MSATDRPMAANYGHRHAPERADADGLWKFPKVMQTPARSRARPSRELETPKGGPLRPCSSPVRSESNNRRDQGGSGADREGTVTNTVAVSGGGAQTLSTTEPTTIGSGLPVTITEPTMTGSALLPFGLANFSAPAIFPDGTPDTQAGGHPYSFTTNISLNTTESVNTGLFGDHERGHRRSQGHPVGPPLGLIGNPRRSRVYPGPVQRTGLPAKLPDRGDPHQLLWRQNLSSCGCVSAI